MTTTRARARTLIGAATAALLALGLLAVPAQAAEGDCRSGNACIWHDLSYTGSLTQSPTYMLMRLFDNDQPTSLASYGNSLCARFWEHDGFTGDYVVFSRPGRGGHYRDPDLRNGGGYGPFATDSWNDRISSQNWQTCPF